MTAKELTEAVRRAVLKTNGQNRKRLITERDVAWAMSEALADWNGYGFVGGGTVAKAYKYPAEQSAVYAIQIAPKVLAVCFGVIDAKTGSETTWATGGAAKNQIAEQRLSFGPRTYRTLVRAWGEVQDELIVPRRVAQAYVRTILPPAAKGAA